MGGLRVSRCVGLRFDASDSAGGLHGTYFGGVLLDEPGAYPTSGTSATFDGVDDYVEIPPLNLGGGEATLMGWARLDGIQASWAGLVFTRAGSSVAGVSTLVTGHMRYHWDGAFYDWDSGLVLPLNQWAFFALVVEPDRATLYLGKDGELSSSTNWTGKFTGWWIRILNQTTWKASSTGPMRLKPALLLNIPGLNGFCGKSWTHSAKLEFESASHLK